MPALLDPTNPYVPPVAPAASSGLYNPITGFDYQRWLAQDPLLTAQLAGVGSSVGSQLAQLDQARREAMIGYGAVPEGVSVDPLTRQAIEQATRGGLSTLAQLVHNYHLANSSAIGNLGARGIVRSSGFGQHVLGNEYDMNVAKANALNALTSTLGGYTQQGLAAQQAGLGQQATLTQGALDRLFSSIQAGLYNPFGTKSAGGTQTAAPKPFSYPARPGYTPSAYAPGGSSPAVSQAIQSRGFKGPLTPSYNLQAYVPGQGVAGTGEPAAIQQQGAYPSTYLPGLSNRQYKIGPHGRAAF